MSRQVNSTERSVMRELRSSSTADKGSENRSTGMVPQESRRPVLMEAMDSLSTDMASEMGLSAMASSRLLLAFAILAIFCLRHGEAAAAAKNITRVLSRASFPKGFAFGAASSAFQYEGAVAEDGRKPSVWDGFSHTPGKIKDGSNADVALDQYHRYKDDIALMAKLNFDAYRVSIAWPRLLPDGKGAINKKAVDHYNSVFNTLLSKGIQPYVTISHWDIPQALVDAYGGVLGKQFVNDYAAYAEACFKLFGDRVKHWMTFNEPHITCVFGYNTGLFAPGRCSSEVSNCTAGNSSTEPYTVCHHFLLAHSAAVSIYKKKYQAKQGGTIGIALDTLYYEPFSNSTRDIEAAERAQQFNLGWMLNPIVFGDYPAVMRSRVGNRLPKFTAAESRLLKGSYDFIGINHYTTLYVADPKTPGLGTNLLAASSSYYHPAYYKDTNIAFVDSRKGKLLGRNINGFYVYPRGIRKLMNYIRRRYHSPTIFITENGISDATSDSAPLQQQLNDVARIQYYRTYLTNLAASIRDGCRVKAYFAWSFLDNWEWNSGFTQRFGLVHVDFKNDLKRIPKRSAQWYKEVLKKK